MARDLYEHTVHVKKSTFESQFKNELQTDGTRTNKLRCTVFTRPRGTCHKTEFRVLRLGTDSPNVLSSTALSSLA